MTRKRSVPSVVATCQKQKCGEHNMLKCVRKSGHDGECCFVVDIENDYPWNVQPKRRSRK